MQKKRIQKCKDCGFIDNPPLTCLNLDKCPYCDGIEWAWIRPKKNETTPNKRFTPVFPNDEARTFPEIQLKNGIYVERNQAVIQSDNKGIGPAALLIMQLEYLTD